MNLLFGFTAGLALLVRTVFTESGPKSGRRSRETILVSQVDLGHLAIVRRMSLLQFFCTYWPCQLNATTMRTKTGAIVDPCCFPEIYVNSISAQRQSDGRRAGLRIRIIAGPVPLDLSQP
jgi:hypothetical protein